MDSLHLSVPADKKLDAQRAADDVGVSVSALFAAFVRWLASDADLQVSDSRKLFRAYAREEQQRRDERQRNGGR